MLKLLLCSAMIAPCFIIPLTGAAKNQMISYEKTSFEDAFIAPEFNSLENCEAAELDVFFYKNYITSHSADYIAEGIELSESCGNATYLITPVIPTATYVDSEDVLGVQTKELALILEAHGVNAIISKADVQSEYNTLSANGRTAKIKIVFGEDSEA